MSTCTGDGYVTTAVVKKRRVLRHIKPVRRTAGILTQSVEGAVIKPYRLALSFVTFQSCIFPSCIFSPPLSDLGCMLA